MRIRNMALMGVFAAAVVGCNSDSGTTAGTTTGAATTAGPATTAPAGKRLTVEVIPKGSTHEYWKWVHAGAEDAAKELGNVDIVWKAPLKEDDRDQQISVVEDAVQQKVDGIVLAPLDDTALRQPVSEAQKAGIPVAIIDSGLKDVKPVSFIMTDNEKGGEIGGDRLAKLLGGKGTVIMLRYEVGSASTDQREKGFLAAMKRNPGIKILSQNQYAGATVETAQSAAENLLPRFKKADGSPGVDGIFCPNESSAFGMLRALEGLKWAGKVHFVGFDSSDSIIKALQSGELEGTVVQNPHNMGYIGVKTIVDSINKKPVQENVDTGATLVTKDNMTQPDIAKLIAPPPG